MMAPRIRAYWSLADVMAHCMISTAGKTLVPVFEDAVTKTPELEPKPPAAGKYSYLIIIHCKFCKHCPFFVPSLGFPSNCLDLFLVPEC